MINTNAAFTNFGNVQSMLGSNKFGSCDLERLKMRYITNDTGYSSFEAVVDDGMRFGIGSVMVFIQIAAFVALIVFIGSANWGEPSIIMGISITQGTKFVVALVAYIVFQVPCFIITERYKGKHIGAFISHDFTYTIIAGVVLFVVGLIFLS